MARPTNLVWVVRSDNQCVTDKTPVITTDFFRDKVKAKERYDRLKKVMQVNAPREAVFESSSHEYTMFVAGGYERVAYDQYEIIG